MPIVFFSTLWGSFFSIAYMTFYSFCFRGKKTTFSDFLTFDGCFNGVLLVIAQLTTLEIMGYMTEWTEIWVFSSVVLGFLGNEIARLKRNWLMNYGCIIALTSAISLFIQPYAPDNLWFLGFSHNIFSSAFFKTFIFMIGLAISIKLSKKIEEPETLTCSLLLTLWAILFFFFSRTAFGAMHGWDYEILTNLSALEIGSLATFCVFNSPPALLKIGDLGRSMLMSQIAILFCLLGMPLFFIIFVGLCCCIVYALKKEVVAYKDHILFLFSINLSMGLLFCLMLKALQWSVPLY